jgi:transposase
MTGVSRPTVYRWCARYQRFGLSGLEDRRSGPGRLWNRIPGKVREQVVGLTLERPELSPRALSVTDTDGRGYFVSEASVYRLLKAQDLKRACPRARNGTASDETYQIDRRGASEHVTPRAGSAVGFSEVPYR